jgi:hypothetical protein
MKQAVVTIKYDEEKLLEAECQLALLRQETKL